MVLHKNRVIGVMGHGKNRDFFVDGKCDECGAVLSKSWHCFIVSSKGDLKCTLKSKYICHDCAKKEFIRDYCTNCDMNCSEEDLNACFIKSCGEGDVRCACPL